MIIKRVLAWSGMDSQRSFLNLQWSRKGSVKEKVLLGPHACPSEVCGDSSAVWIHTVRCKLAGDVKRAGMMYVVLQLLLVQ